VRRGSFSHTSALTASVTGSGCRAAAATSLEERQRGARASTRVLAADSRCCCCCVVPSCWLLLLNAIIIPKGATAPGLALEAEICGSRDLDVHVSAAGGRRARSGRAGERDPGDMRMWCVWWEMMLQHTLASVMARVKCVSDVTPRAANPRCCALKAAAASSAVPHTNTHSSKTQGPKHTTSGKVTSGACPPRWEHAAATDTQHITVGLMQPLQPSEQNA
jgi:hypothetical protein